jgi:prevent-host-death family protein
MDTWQLQDAKNRFSEVVENARTRGPQLVTRRGVEAVVVLSHEEYERLSAPRQRLVDLMRGSPLVGVDLELERQAGAPRNVEL